MGDSNYFSGIIKILENPTQSFSNSQILTSTVRAELPQIRQNRIVSVVFWGNLVNEVKNYYQTNDYILIEGYISIEKNDPMAQKPKRVIISALKVYPFLLKSN